MPVPQPRSLSLKEAANYVADRCEVSLEEAKAALDRAFREYSLGVFSDRFEKVQGWQGAEIDWENSAVVGGEHLTINGIHYTVRVTVFRQHLNKWIAQATPAYGRSRTISLNDASVRIGEAKFGADWIGKLTERERWLIKRYVERRHQSPSSILAEEIAFVGPGGPKIPVNDPKLVSEVERARDRLEHMNDQYDEVYDWLKDRGFDTETASLDLTQFERAFAATFSAAAMLMRAPTQSIIAAANEQSSEGVEPQKRVTTESVLPETGSGRATGDAYTHSGFPGRPSKGKHLIDDEFDRRVAAGQALPTVADEAKALLDWFKREHPTIARPTLKTIQENIRTPHRQWRASQPGSEAK
jgi:hypothetical protein